MRPKARLLVVEDEQVMRMMLALVLTQEGYEVETVDGGAAAIAAIEKRKFDVAITDLVMPGMSGLETLAALKRVDPSMEVIVATAFGTVETAIAAIKGGAFDYIQKPFDLNELRFRIARALEKRNHYGMLALYEASRALLATIKHSDLVSLVLVLAAQVNQADSAGLALRRPGRDGLRFHRAANPPQPSEALIEGLVQRARSIGGPARYPSLLLPQLPVAEPAIGSAMVYPLAVRERTLGGLVVCRAAQSEPFGDEEVERGLVFANQIALALDNDFMYTEMDAALRKAEPR